MHLVKYDAKIGITNLPDKYTIINVPMTGVTAVKGSVKSKTHSHYDDYMSYLGSLLNFADYLCQGSIIFKTVRLFVSRIT